ncbi:hypothetical protein ACERT0_004521 [Escherichia coli]|uniref:Uncharacterized protein n=6 Tax=Enterobacteriaceae TaxID=543 RepID=A0A722KS49_SALER|nr:MULTISPECIES: hypothetical protein [Enterobacteriaceae]HAD8819583.1 hypothetical protein [Salmonella enterica]HDG7856957.1 hypothetical protein [Klebsiella quasipneumoniae]HDG8010417.1 hypothetical protein [Klebsiella pneumoniae]EEV7411723.1 hypothetical protein [Escherichia coli]EFA5156635.1 hypothetical protein [Escherichia coli]
MECKITNQIILALVFLLTFLLICIILKAIFFGSTNFQWGSFTDWISSLSTLGTFAVAYAAYKKAPEWMAQKHYDIVSKVIEEAVYEDLRKLSSFSNQYRNHMLHTSKILRSCLNSKGALPSDIKETLDKVESLLIEFFNLSYSIQNRLKAIPRYNYVITPYTVTITETIKRIADRYNSLQTQFELAASEVPISLYESEAVINKLMKEIFDIQLEVIELNNNLNNFIRSIYADNKSIAEFIAIKK